jgi:Big-like domain-containing protein/putative pyrroloquinoline-quinone binding quinoprotein
MCPRFLLLLVIAVALAVQAALGAYASAAIPAWTTYRHDAARSGIDPDSTSPLTPSRAWQTPALDGELYGQPLVSGSYVYVATENDSVYKLAAATGAVVWSEHLATPERSSVAPCGDISPSIGVTSTPVIDPATERLYVVGAVSTSGVVHHELFALGLSSGQPIPGFPITVDPRYPNGGAAVNQLQRAGLALDGGRILIGYGGNDGDCNTYWGWLVSAPTDGTTGIDSFQVDTSHTAGAIWAAGNAPPLDAAGDVFIATGNGIGNSSSDPEYGDSVVKLNGSASPLAWWAPPDWQSLDSTDADLGSSMPTLLPGGFLFQSGKDGNGYLLNSTALGHVSSATAEVSGFCPGGSFGGSVYDPGNSTIYAACAGGLRALSLGSGSAPSLAPKPGFSAPSGATGPPMIAGELVWVTNYSSGTLYGLDLSSGATSRQFLIPENTVQGGSDVNHFASPSAGGGRLFVASGDQVTAYTIAQPPAPAATTTTLTSSANPVPAGTAVLLTAAVTPPPDGGTVTFTDAGSPIAGCSSIGVSAATAGQAVCQTTLAQAGTHNLAASYSGDAFYAPSASAGFAESVTSGTGSAGGGGASGGGPHSPVISHPSISPRRFTATHAATLRLSLSEAATLTVAITKPGHGHVVGHGCSLRVHRGRPCLVRVTLVRLHFHARAGRNAFKLSLHRLATGQYTAFVYASDSAGRRSPTIRLTFTIVRA